MALTSECEKHDWSWDPADDVGCPVCYGIAGEQERIINLLPKDLRFWIGNRAYNKLIAHIKGENK